MDERDLPDTHSGAVRAPGAPPPGPVPNQDVDRRLLGSEGGIMAADNAPASSPFGALAVGAIGVHLWVVTLLLPVLSAGVRSWIDLVVLPLPLVPLILGALAMARETPATKWVAGSWLLAAYPPALAAVAAHRSDLAELEAWGPAGYVLIAISVVSYAAAASDACARPLALRATRAQRLAPGLVPGEGSRRPWLRRGTLGTLIAGAIAVSVLAPSLGDRAELVARWGAAAEEARTLAALIGGAASCFGIAALFGTNLRALRESDARSPWPAVVVGGIVAVFALAFVWVLRALEAR